MDLGGLDIWVLSISFQKSCIGWPQQPLTERISDISEKLGFWWSIPKKGESLVILVPGKIQPSGSVIFLWNEAGKVNETMEVVEACRVKITTEDFRCEKMILEFSLILIFLKNIDLIESWNIILKFSTFFVGGCWGQLMLLSWKQVHETQISKPLEATRHHHLTKIVGLSTPQSWFTLHSSLWDTLYNLT